MEVRFDAYRALTFGAHQKCSVFGKGWFDEELGFVAAGVGGWLVCGRMWGQTSPPAGGGAAPYTPPDSDVTTTDEPVEPAPAPVDEAPAEEAPAAEAPAAEAPAEAPAADPMQ